MADTSVQIVSGTNHATIAGLPTYTTGLTVCMWVWLPFATIQANGNSAGDIFENYIIRATNAGWPRWDMSVSAYYNSDGSPRFGVQYFDTGSNIDHDTGTIHFYPHPAANGWVFCVGRWDAVAGNFKFDFAYPGDAALTAGLTETAGTAAAFNVNGGLNSFDIGNQIGNGSATASVYNFTSWAGILSDAQVLAQMASVSPVNSPWNQIRFSWTGSAVLTDQTGNGHPAVEVGTLTAGATAPLEPAAGITLSSVLSGTYQPLVDAKVLVGGTWQQIVEVQVLANGVWNPIVP